ncbi:diguanylate cyclase [Desulfosporosinus metallidurans]|uniref:GGDEF/response regulator receiver domain protein n=1 Tax=Desulfosporosinus metallidurans TaxID=1888891 RepID=A0A1Q8R1N6_9FIRM|nr:diguanylate cyclase [Desulfosporosinus metallidurans]OLN33539.1 GGDEF/response regulator receiver domain protein [Desulfosporosinus metallidurans]
MLKDLFLNVTIIISVISVGNQLLIKEEITPSSSLKLRLFFSSMAGVLGILLMVNGVQVLPGVMLDFGNIATILSAGYCGFGAAVITGLLIGIFRLFYAGITFASIIAALTAIMIGLGCGYIARIVASKFKKWVLMNIFILILPSISFVIILNNKLFLFKTLSIYWIGTSIVSILVYYYVKYLDLSRFLYKEYQIYSSKDPRTGLNNVRQFDNELNKMIKGLRDDSIIALAFIDIDLFKKINDTYGHQNGDKILEDLGKILLSSCSYSDIVSRNGGDEFSVLMTDCPRDKLLEVAERIRLAVQEHKFYLLNGQVISITVSIGVAIYPDTVSDINLIVEKADLALYEAKRAGRNRVIVDKNALV